MSDEPPRARAQSVPAAARRTIRSTGIPGATRRSRRRAREDKPIFLSIGYSTCHWCHVMEHESFERRRRRGGAERALRLDQGRSRGAARRRSRLHDVRAGDHRSGRLADERVAHAGPEAVLRRHLLPADLEVGPAGIRRHPAAKSRRVWTSRARRRSCSRPKRSPRSCKALESAAPVWTLPTPTRSPRR